MAMLFAQMAPWPCEPVDEVDRPAGVVPHYLPETIYPEYMLKLKTMARLPRLPRRQGQGAGAQGAQR